MNELLTNQPVYVVLTAALIIWVGIAVYLARVDARLARLERRMKNTH
ncbi:MAG: CcmD family protein [bacterium]|nr:CcmD family protein [bacterium]